MISRPPLMRYFDTVLAWAGQESTHGTFKAFGLQLRELRAVEALIETLPVEYTRTVARIAANIREYGVHEGGAHDVASLRSVENQFSIHPSRLYADEEKQDLLATLVLKAYDVYDRPKGASPLRKKSVVIEGDDRYVYTCPVTYIDDNASVDAFFECEFSRDDLSLIHARFERSSDGCMLGRIAEHGILAVNEERDDVLQSMGLTSVPTV